MATLKDVAKAAGVSPSTVSYTLRGGAYVSQETPGQVCAIIERNKNITPVDILHCPPARLGSAPPPSRESPITTNVHGTFAGRGRGMVKRRAAISSSPSRGDQWEASAVIRSRNWLLNRAMSTRTATCVVLCESVSRS